MFLYMYVFMYLILLKYIHIYLIKAAYMHKRLLLLLPLHTKPSIVALARDNIVFAGIGNQVGLYRAEPGRNGLYHGIFNRNGVGQVLRFLDALSRVKLLAQLVQVLDMLFQRTI